MDNFCIDVQCVALSISSFCFFSYFLFAVYFSFRTFLLFLFNRKYIFYQGYFRNDFMGLKKGQTRISIFLYICSKLKTNEIFLEKIITTRIF